MKRSLRIALATSAVLLTGLGLAACSSAGSASVLGTWGTPDTRGEVSLEFTDDGRVAGSDGCNRVMGGWEADGNKITFSQMATTMMACPDIDVWFVDVAGATFNGDTLTVTNSSGDEIGSIERAN